MQKGEVTRLLAPGKEEETYVGIKSLLAQGNACVVSSGNNLPTGLEKAAPPPFLRMINWAEWLVRLDCTFPGAGWLLLLPGVLLWSASCISVGPWIVQQCYADSLLPVQGSCSSQ